MRKNGFEVPGGGGVSGDGDWVGLGGCRETSGGCPENQNHRVVQYNTIKSDFVEREKSFYNRSAGKLSYCDHGGGSTCC